MNQKELDELKKVWNKCWMDYDSDNVPNPVHMEKWIAKKQREINREQKMFDNFLYEAGLAQGEGMIRRNG
jgi:hypothetical protein